jgi:hypothetical protein
MKTLRALFGLSLVVAVVFVAYKVLPPYTTNYQFQDAIESEARLNSYSHKSEAEIHDIIVNKARELEIPIRPEQIVVRRNGNEISISARYTVHVDLPIQPFDLSFSPATRNKPPVN